MRQRQGACTYGAQFGPLLNSSPSSTTAPSTLIPATNQPPNSVRDVRVTRPRVISRSRPEPGPHHSVAAKPRPETASDGATGWLKR